MLRPLVVTAIFAAAVASGALVLLAVDRIPTSAQAGNTPPVIVMDRFRREYKAPNDVNIKVDLRNIAEDREDRPADLEWFVDAKTLGNAQFGYESPDSKQVLVFTPEVNFIGSDEVNIDVKDSGGLSTRAAITLTWQDARPPQNIPPLILRDELRGKTAGIGATVCYALRDKAVDADDPITSLRWFAEDYSRMDMAVTGVGTREMCLAPTRSDFAGCIPANFVVRDPRGQQDQHAVSTCWRKIEVVLPMISQRVRLR